MSAFYLGVDLGTTNLKAAIFGENGECLGDAACRLEVKTAADGTREQNLEDIRQAIAEVFSRIRQSVPEAWTKIAGIGFGAQGGSGAIVDAESGTPHSPMFLWNDMRCTGYVDALAAAMPQEYWQKLSLRKRPGTGLARLKWLQETQPGLIRPGRLYAGAGEFVYFLFTGEWRQDACNALQIGCYNVPENRLDNQPLQLLDLDTSYVAPLRNGHQTHPLSAAGAQLTGLPPGIPVAGPYMDHEAGYLSAAEIGKRPLQCSLGTAWVGNFVLPKEKLGDSPIQLPVVSPLCTEDRLVIQPLFTGNVMWDWGLATFLDENLKTALSQLADIFSESLLPPEGLVALPWFNLPNLKAATLGAGVFYGMSIYTSRNDLIRALAASLCYDFKRMFANVVEAGVVDCIVLGGGGSKGPEMRKLLGSLFAPLPVYALADEDLAGARGCLYAFSPELAMSTPVPVETVNPEQHEAIEQGYRLYLKTFHSIYDDSSSLDGYVLH